MGLCDDDDFKLWRAHCPACGEMSLELRGGQLECWKMTCPDKSAAHKVLSDPEIHHIVRFGRNGVFNAQHPLRERIGGALLDCAIHEEIREWMLEGSWSPKGTWRVKAAGQHNLDRNYIWEKI